MLSSDLPDITRSRIETLHARLQPEVAKSLAMRKTTDAIEQRAEEVFHFFIAELAGLEAQAQAWRLALEAEADAQALAERDAATGTDAWVAALTGTTRDRSDRGPADGARLI